PAEAVLDLVDRRLERRPGDVALLRRREQPAEQLLPVELLAAPVLLDDVDGRRLDPLVRREALVAAQALAAPADRPTGPGGARVDDLAVAVLTVRALHGGVRCRSVRSAIAGRPTRVAVWRRRSAAVAQERGDVEIVRVVRRLVAAVRRRRRRG